MASLVKIEQALITAFKNGGFGLAIAYENLVYTPVTGTPYAELLTHIGETNPLTLNDLDETSGLFRVVLHYPKDGGTIAARKKADEVTTVFKIGSRFSFGGVTLTVTSNNQRISSLDDGWHNLIIDIFYTAFLAR
jgi:hypothetical protein